MAGKSEMEPILHGKWRTHPEGGEETRWHVMCRTPIPLEAEYPDGLPRDNGFITCTMCIAILEEARERAREGAELDD